MFVGHSLLPVSSLICKKNMNLIIIKNTLLALSGGDFMSLCNPMIDASNHGLKTAHKNTCTQLL